MVDLCIGGGNFKGLALLGALEYLHSMDYLTHIENFYGCSVGSAIGIFYLIGFKPREIFEEVLDMNLNNFWDPDIKNINKNYSLLSSKLFNHFSYVFSKKENINITIKEFNEKYSTKINIITTSITSKESVIFCEKKFPDIEVMKVIKASCSIPFIFSPIKINEEYYVDVSVRCFSGCPNFNIIGYILKLSSIQTPNIDCFKNYLIEVLLTVINEQQIEDNKNTIIITLPESFETKINFNDITDSIKTELFYYGLKKTQEKMQNN
jgi:hypothetical protein